ncbi:MAG: type II secretion system protein J [Xenococcaceae cyanobacterium]
MKTKDLVKILKWNKSSAGFTLIELIIASFISVIVIGAAGFGLMAMLRGNKTASIEADRRTEINRALEFISDEIRRAETIDTDPTPAFTNAKDDSSYSFDPEDSSSGKNNAQPILALNIPGVTAPVLYYISPPESTAWQGPRVIYRFGPSYNNDGSYSNPTAPNNWVVEPLVARIDDDSSGSLSASCPSGFTASPGAAIQGFYACVEDNGETAQIYMIGQLENGETYKADTNTYARAKAEDLTGENYDQNYSNKPVNNCRRAPAITCPGDVEVIPQVLGSLMGCEPGGSPCRMTTEFIVKDSDGNSTTKLTIDADGNSTDSNGNSTNSFILGENEELEIIVTPDATHLGENAYEPSQQNNSNPVSIISNESQVELLTDARNNDTNGDGKKALEYVAWEPDNFKSLKQLLASTTNSENSKTFIQNDKPNLEDGQYIVAFEIGQTDSSVPGYDFQDHVVLITVKENN